MKIATILVPREGSRADTMIAPGSGIVSMERERPSGMAVVYYEGNLYGAANLRTYRERVRCAAGRCFARYPTVAMMGFEKAHWADNFIVVGTIDATYAIDLTDPQSVATYEARYLSR